ncbi:S-methyl-5'-thioadenosine phosphorylase [Geothermobacter hydrogeniphilus]|uniref:S-methyl-5'-thioadenosine phosphorylase n=1 Tax=Geothermobacter hydrogeniphilus TaxID=1969733 RepID=A0A2K2H8Q6_9BACT|nr:S-methyl-5'-thioadenosine phosphorylase [Geothermobacter hydrogeniphilus]PNU19619.1 S-methyl-5'-thioadenosine phosphorylase [Geothermobacter hydrogeniphilus]
MNEMTIGVIGGSGLYAMEGLEDVREEKVDTPYGDPSDVLVTGRLGDVRMVFLPRHGRGHRLLPSEVNFRANIYALKKLGVDQVISVSAVGSMKEEIVPGHIVIPDQFFDRTVARDSTFFGEGVVGHVQFADPVCDRLAAILAQSAREVGATVHEGGIYLCMEGPQFSTRAESRIYRAWGVDIIGMTNSTEAKLAREAELCYSTIALATDYDCWYEGHEDVSVEAVVALIQQNVAMAKDIIAAAVKRLTGERSCNCGVALQYAIMTDRALIPAATREKLAVIMGKHLS